MLIIGKVWPSVDEVHKSSDITNQAWYKSISRYAQTASTCTGFRIFAQPVYASGGSFFRFIVRICVINRGRWKKHCSIYHELAQIHVRMNAEACDVVIIATYGKDAKHPPYCIIPYKTCPFPCAMAYLSKRFCRDSTDTHRPYSTNRLQYSSESDNHFSSSCHIFPNKNKVNWKMTPLATGDNPKSIKCVCARWLRKYTLGGY